MANSLALVWDLIAVDHASGTFGRVGAAADSASGGVKRLLEGFGLLAAGTAVAASVKQAADFQAQMLLIQTQAGATAQEVKNLSPAVLSLAGQVAQAPEALATSLYHVESTGLRGAQALDAVKVAAEGAKVGHADLEQTTNALTALIASGMVPATETYSQAMGQLNTIVGSGDMKMQDLNDALSSGLLVTTKQYGVTINDVGAALADFGDNNIRGADAATMLRMAVQAIAKPGKDAEGALGRIGLTVQQLQSDEQTGGLNKALTDLHTHLVNSGIDASQWGTILTDAFTKKAGTGLITLVGTFDRFQQKYQEVSKGADSFGSAWQATTKTASFQFDQLRQSVDTLGIQLGTHLLPILGDTAGWLAHTGVPAIEHMGSAVGSAVHWFSQLPTPIKDAALALGALAAVNRLGVFDAIATGATRIAALGVGATNAASSLAGLGRAGAGLLNFFGGPIVLGIAAVTAAFVESQRQVDTWAQAFTQGGKAASDAMDQIQKQEEATLAPSDWLNRAKGLWNDGIAQIQGYSSALDEAQQKSQKQLDALGPLQYANQAVTTDTNNLNQAISTFGQNSQEAQYWAWRLSLAQGDVKTQEGLMDQATRGANGALQDQIGLQQQLSQAGVTLDQSQLSAKQSIRDYQKAVKDTNLTEDDRTQALDNVSQAMFGVLDAAKRKADAETQGLPAQLQTNQEIVRQRDALDAMVKKLGFVPPALQSMYDQLNGPTAQALQATQTNVNTAGTAMTTVTTNDIPGLNKALGDLAKAAGTTVPQSITGAFIPTMQGVDAQLNGPTNTAIQGTTGQLDSFMRSYLNFPQVINGPFANAMSSGQAAMGMTGGQARTTQTHIDDLGLAIAGLPPSHNTVITADASQAQNTINAFLTKVQAQGFVGAVFNLNPVGSGAQGGLIGLPPVPHRAAGGPIAGPGTGTSDSVLIAASNGEHMWTAAEVNAAGGHAGVEMIRKAVLASGRAYAAGGPITTTPWQMAYPIDWNASIKNRANASLAQMVSWAPGAPANVSANAALGAQMAARYYGWTGAEWNALYALGMRESGWRNTAQNPTSTAYGIAQFLDSTWASVGLSKTSSPVVQIAGMLKYIQQRYRDPLGAWAHETKFGWYRDGTNYVPGDGPAWLHKGEAVIPASRNQGAPYQDRPMHVTLQLDGAAVTDLLEGRAVQVVTDYADAAYNRGQYS
ncbi:MAG: phage tail tape measure protein [Frankiaceae bacterium]